MTTGSLEHNLRVLAQDGVKITIWHTKAGRYQANVSEAAGQAWTCHTDDDPIAALREATRLRLAAIPGRVVKFDPVPAPDEDDEDLIG